MCLGGAHGGDAHDAWHRHVWDVDFTRNRSISCLAYLSDLEVKVVSNIVFTGRRRFVSDTMAVSLHAFLASLPETLPGVQPEPKDDTESVVKVLPWAEKGMKKKLMQEKRHQGAHSKWFDVKSSAELEDGIFSDEDKLLDAQWEQLTDLRKEWLTAPELRTEDFYVTVFKDSPPSSSKLIKVPTAWLGKLWVKRYMHGAHCIV